MHRGEDLRSIRDLQEPEHSDGDEPHQHDRAEHRADSRRSTGLQEKQPEHDEAHGSRYGLFQAFDGTEHGDRQRDRPIAIEKGGAEESEQHQDMASRPSGSAPRVQQCYQGDDAALTAIKDGQKVLDRDD